MTSPKNGAIVIIEGLVGAGKSTAVRTVAALAPELGYERCVVLMEEILPSLLTLYISDMKKYAFPFQTIVARDRCETMRRAVREARGGALVLIDRGLLGDMAFALMQARLGNIDAREYAAYKDMLTDAHPDFVPRALSSRSSSAGATRDGALDVPIVIAYLECEPRVAFARMRARGNADEVAGYTLEYFEHLRSAYDATIGEFEIAAGSGHIAVHRFDYNTSLEVAGDGLLHSAGRKRLAQIVALAE